MRNSNCVGRSRLRWRALPAALLALAGLFSVEAALATEVVPLTLNETVRQADEIVIGTVTAKKSRWETAPGGGS